MKYDLHTHDYPPSYFELIRRTPGEFAFGTYLIDRAVTSVAGLDIPEHEERAIFSGTALRILNNV